MSLKTIPGLGKSGTSRMAWRNRSARSSAAVSVIAGGQVPGENAGEERIEAVRGLEVLVEGGRTVRPESPGDRLQPISKARSAVLGQWLHQLLRQRRRVGRGHRIDTRREPFRLFRNDERLDRERVLLVRRGRGGRRGRRARLPSHGVQEWRSGTGSRRRVARLGRGTALFRRRLGPACEHWREDGAGCSRASTVCVACHALLLKSGITWADVRTKIQLPCPVAKPP